MATYFGEVIEPDSRSFVTDGEECFLEQNYSIETVPVDDCENGLTHEFIIVASGKVLSDFAAAYIIEPGSKVLERYNLVRTEGDHYLKEKVISTLYKLTPNTLLCVCENLPHAYFSHKLINKLNPWVQTTRHVVILTSDNMSNFKPTGGMYPFLRSLRTKACTLSVQTQNLELPNTILGLPAALLSWCQAKRFSALMYVIYVESSVLDSFITEPLLQLMRSSDFLNSLITTNTIKLRSIISNAQIQNSNLYL